MGIKPPKLPLLNRSRLGGMPQRLISFRHHDNQDSPVLVIYGSIPLMILNVCSNAWGSFMRKERRTKMGPSGMP